MATAEKESTKQLTVSLDPVSVLSRLLGLLLIWAALSKISDINEFLNALAAYQIGLPLVLLKAIAIVLPWVELICGMLLIVSPEKPEALSLTLVMFGVFLLATAQAWLRGLNITCGCFDLSLFGIGHGHPVAKVVESVWFAFFRNLALTGLACWLFRKVWTKTSATG